MADDTWLDLGNPQADPRWGSARGRAWCAKMAYAPDLQAAFLFGEGVHGWWDKETGRYMDDLWAYDVPAHRWVCVRPGTDVQHVDLRLNDHGVEVNQAGEPVPVAQMAHGYEGTEYNTDAHQFMFMPCSGGYWEAAMGPRRMAWLKEKRNEVARNCSPWLYDTRTGKWDRRPTPGPAPHGTFGDVLMYIPTVRKVFYRTRESELWWYDPAANTWAPISPKGSPPFGIDPTACYDTKRDRIYIGGGSYPVAKGTNALWIFDVKTETWIDPHPKGSCCGGSNSYNTNIATMNYDQANDVVVLNRRQREEGRSDETGIWIYDPAANAWDEHPRPFPADMTWKQVSGFYDPALNVHLYFSAGDSQTGGTIRAYRYRAVRP